MGFLFFFLVVCRRIGGFFWVISYRRIHLGRRQVTRDILVAWRKTDGRARDERCAERQVERHAKRYARATKARVAG